MTSIERVLTTLGFKEPDRVPLLLLLSHYGAKEAGVTIKDYFADVDTIVEQQIAMRKKYATDCYYTFQYAAVETEAYGGKVIYHKDTPPNAGRPIITNEADIRNMKAMPFEEVASNRRILQVTKRLYDHAQGGVPIIGVVMSPFSVPVIQMGFHKYLDLIYRDRKTFWNLMDKNIEFCVKWANAQLEAGATAICYFDPLASPTMIEKPTYMMTGHKVATETMKLIKGPTATHLASGRTLPVIDEIAQTGTAMIGFSCDEKASRIKDNTNQKISILGNLNGIEMCRWTREDTLEKSRELIEASAGGGGFLLSDTHGEIPYQVPEEVLLAFQEAIERWGTYPIVGAKVE